MHQKKIQILILIMVVICAVLLSGCRESLVIQEVIYDQASEDIDFNNKMKIAENNENSSNEDKTLPRKKNSETDKKTDEEHQASKKGDKKNEGEAPDTKYNSDAKENQDNDSEGSKPGETGEKDSAAEDDSSAGASDNPNDRQIYDGNGNKVDLPEEVNSAVVTGDAAPIVQMLGGKSILSGSSSSFTSNSLAMRVFASEDVENTETLWDGDGSSAMSSSNFQKLLQMKPDVCVTISGQNSFSSSQLNTLKTKKIAVVTLPALTSSDNIRSAVSILGEMIGDRSGQDGGVNAKELASEYDKYCKNLIREVKGKTGLFTWNNIDFNTGSKNAQNTASDGQYTLYVSQWENASYKITTNSGGVLYRDSGVAVAPQGYSNSPLSYFLSVAGVCNNGARFVRSAKSEYAIVPFNRNVLHHNTSGTYSFYSDTNESFVKVQDASMDIGLGESSFKSILVESNDVKNKIQASDSWKFYGKVTANNVTEYGFIASDGSLIPSYIRGNYSIYVNPCGVSSWTDGSVESILETKWAAWKFHSAYSESQVKEELKNFYSKFYRYNLSDSQVNSILSGK
ncbi:hypothetical protein LI177_03810 [bacterium 210820-DFI.6.37]|nr:hypothetical protein [bacterium 210820-DFI.6.37]